MSRLRRTKNGEESARRAALEFRERLRKRAQSADSIWNAAIHECMELLGPACRPIHRVEECQKCWVLNKMRGALRLEVAGYAPLKERMLSSLERLRQRCTLKGLAHSSYTQAIDDITVEMGRFMEDSE